MTRDVPIFSVLWSQRGAFGEVVAWSGAGEFAVSTYTRRKEKEATPRTRNSNLIPPRKRVASKKEKSPGLGVFGLIALTPAL